MQDRQELMTRAFRVMNEKLFAPRGIPVPELPILTDGSGVFPWEAGATHYRGRQPVSIAVAPIQDDVEAVGVLAHEMAHAALPMAPIDGVDGHGPSFANVVYDIGLVGHPTATTVGPRFREWAEQNIF